MDNTNPATHSSQGEQLTFEITPSISQFYTTCLSLCHING